jgi:hypothetical protein
MLGDVRRQADIHRIIGERQRHAGRPDEGVRCPRERWPGGVHFSRVRLYADVVDTGVSERSGEVPRPAADVE